MTKMHFTVDRANGQSESIEVEIIKLVIAGWTGRDRAAVEAHIRELEELGVPRPSTTPVYYRVSSALLTSAATIEVAGESSSGEVEFVILKHEGTLFVGVGSDHTDRKVETYNITVSKQMCAKPVAPTLWPFDELKSHWHQLQLSSYVDDDVAYQHGEVTAMLDPEDLIAGLTVDGFPDGTMMFCGTLPAIGGIRPSRKFRLALTDPVLGREIAHHYVVNDLPIVG